MIFVENVIIIPYKVLNGVSYLQSKYEWNQSEQRAFRSNISGIQIYQDSLDNHTCSTISTFSYAKEILDALEKS
jgi:hypothetical protein